MAALYRSLIWEPIWPAPHVSPIALIVFASIDLAVAVQIAVTVVRVRRDYSRSFFSAFADGIGVYLMR